MGTKKVMTVAMLMERLSAQDPEAVVLVDNHGEFRTVGDGDVRGMQMVELTTDDEELVDHNGPAVVIMSWS